MASEEIASMKPGHLLFDEASDDEEPTLRRMSRLSIEASDDGVDGDAEMSDDEKHSRNYKNDNDEDCFPMDGVSSVPETPGRAGPWGKEYSSETEAGRGRKRKGLARRRRERLLDRAWELKRSMSGGEISHCRVLVRPRGPDSESMCMDMDEVKACRELGLELPSDWTVEIPCGFSGVDTSSDGNSPSGGAWKISSPGDCRNLYLLLFFINFSVNFE